MQQRGCYCLYVGKKNEKTHLISSSKYGECKTVILIPIHIANNITLRKLPKKEFYLLILNVHFNSGNHNNSKT